MHAFDRQTDGQTDRILIARPRLYSMQRGMQEAHIHCVSFCYGFCLSYEPKFIIQNVCNSLSCVTWKTISQYMTSKPIVTVTVTEALVLRSLLEDRGRITESICIMVPVETSPSIAAVSAPSVACSMLAVQQQKRLCRQFVDVSDEVATINYIFVP